MPSLPTVAFSTGAKPLLVVGIPISALAVSTPIAATVPTASQRRADRDKYHNHQKYKNEQFLHKNFSFLI
jgi:hypothetical protein